MNKNDYWNEKENEKYKKMKVGMEFNNLDFSKMKIFSKITEKIVKLIAIISSIIGILTLILIFTIVLGMWKNLGKRADPDVIENMQFTFDEKIEIISEKKQDKVIVYKLRPKDNKKIEFSAYKEGSRTYNDYQSQAYKYFVENILDENIRSKLVIDERSSIENGVNFLIYHTYIEPKSFEEIDECTEMMIQIKEIAEKQNKRVYSYITSNSMLKIEKYHSNISYSQKLSVEDFKTQEKYQYINYLKENNFSTEHIPKNELEKYKPLYLEIIINGEELMRENEELLSSFSCAKYNENTQEYEVNLITIIKHIDAVEINNPLFGSVSSFEFKGKKYNIDYSAKEAKKNTLPSECRVSYLEQYLDAEIQYDYENKKIYIKIVDK